MRDRYVVERWALRLRYVAQKCRKGTCVTAEEQCLEVGRGENRHPYRSYTSIDKATIRGGHNVEGNKWTLPPPTDRI